MRTKYHTPYFEVIREKGQNQCRSQKWLKENNELSLPKLLKWNQNEQSALHNIQWSFPPPPYYNL